MPLNWWKLDQDARSMGHDIAIHSPAIRSTHNSPAIIFHSWRLSRRGSGKSVWSVLTSWGNCGDISVLYCTTQSFVAASFLSTGSRTRLIKLLCRCFLLHCIFLGGKKYTISWITRMLKSASVFKRQVIDCVMLLLLHTLATLCSVSTWSEISTE